MYNEGN